jgi:hypothetical protein
MVDAPAVVEEGEHMFGIVPDGTDHVTSTPATTVPTCPSTA